MKKKTKKPILIPFIVTLIMTLFCVFIFISSLQVRVELSPRPNIRPNILANGTSFHGFIDVTIPINITNDSPATLLDITINVSLSIVSIEHFSWFPDTTIISISKVIERIDSNEMYQDKIQVNISDFIAILAILDVYLVLDVEVSLKYNFGLFFFPFHWVGRIQDYWKAPF
ncbi:MAG: hypothetical protein ACFFAU_05320 [Candidatus Hodarchaeota archaeon]